MHQAARSAWDYASPVIVNYQLSIINSLNGGLAQLARAPALQAGGQRFESVILHFAVAVRFLFPHFATASIFDMLSHKTVSKDFFLSHN